MAIIPQLRAATGDRSKPLLAAAWAATLRAAGKRKEADEIERGDEIAKRLLTAPVMRADATPGTSTGAGWGDEIVTTTVAGFISSIAPISAGAKLIVAGERVGMGAHESINFPVADTSATTPAWVKEGDPITVKNFSFSAATLGPARKIATIVPFTKELVKRNSAGRAIFDRMLREHLAHSLDLALFSADAGSDSAVAGLRYNLAPIASYGNPTDDVSALLAEVAALGGSGAAAIIANPREASKIAVALPQLAIPVWPSRALPLGTLLALDTAAFASSVSDIEFVASEEATIHMSDTPLPIVSGAPVTADPVRSMYQTATIALRTILDIAFVQRNSATAIMGSIAW